MEQFTGSFKIGILTEKFQIKYSLSQFPRYKVFLHRVLVKQDVFFISRLIC